MANLFEAPHKSPDLSTQALLISLDFNQENGELNIRDYVLRQAWSRSAVDLLKRFISGYYFRTATN
jgi:hypothetical protein